MSEQLRVLNLIKGLGHGGAEQLLVSSAYVRDREAFDYEVAYLLPSHAALVPDLESLGVPVHCLGVRHEQDLRWLPGLRRMLTEGAYDVVHVHSPYAAGMARLVIRTMPEKARPRIVSTEHNVWASHVRATRCLNAATFRIGDAWLAVSEAVRWSIPERLRERVEVVVHGVVLDNIAGYIDERAAVRAELGISRDVVAIATVANFRSQKGYPDLLSAARSLADRAVPARFFVIGQGPLEAEIRALHASLGLGDYVEFLGYRPDVLRVLAGCDLFALASHHEGYPVAVMEALAIGLPIVSTEVGGVPHAVTQGIQGLLVPPNQPEALADAIEALVCDSERRARMSAAAFKRGHDFSIESAVRRSEEIYRDVVTRVDND